jgi:hypothetical protein
MLTKRIRLRRITQQRVKFGIENGALMAGNQVNIFENILYLV